MVRYNGNPVPTVGSDEIFSRELATPLETATFRHQRARDMSRHEREQAGWIKDRLARMRAQLDYNLHNGCGMTREQQMLETDYCDILDNFYVARSDVEVAEMFERDCAEVLDRYDMKLF